jgi:hypothetical protein
MRVFSQLLDNYVEPIVGPGLFVNSRRWKWLSGMIKRDDQRWTEWESDMLKKWALGVHPTLGRSSKRPIK